jgi:gas vesicle protein
MFAIGACVGAVVGILYAPQSGRETRKLVVRKARQLKGSAQDAIHNMKEFAQTSRDSLVARARHK